MILGNTSATYIPQSRRYTKVEKALRITRAKRVVQAAKRYIADTEHQDPSIPPSDKELEHACTILLNSDIDPDEV